MSKHGSKIIECILCKQKSALEHAFALLKHHAKIKKRNDMYIYI